MKSRGPCILCWTRWFLPAIVIVLWGCRPAPQGPVRVGLLAWPPYEIFYLARDLDQFNGSEIELVDFSSSAGLTDAFQAGEVDAICIPADLFVAKRHTDPESRIVMAVDVSDGGGALLSRPGINSTQNLYGAVVGFSPSSLGAYMLARALDQTLIEFDDLVLQDLDEVEQLDAYEFGEVDALVAYEPMRSRIINAGAQVLFDSSQIPGEIIDVLVAHEDTIDRREDALQKLINGFFVARKAMIEQPMESAAAVVEREGLSSETYLAALDRVILPGPDINRDMLAGPDASIRLRLESIAEVLRRTGVIGELPELEDALDDRFVRKVSL